MEISLGLCRPRTLLNLFLVPALYSRFGKPTNRSGLPHNRVGTRVTAKQASMLNSGGGS